MILKSKEARSEDIAELNRLLSLPLQPGQRTRVEQELRFLQAGERNEENAAYFLDFHIKNSLNWMVIHDLRVEHRGNVAQIDHLVINRLLHVYVLESKSFSFGIKITPESEFLRWNGKGYDGIESPIEQNNRHIYLLEQSISDRKLAPTRLGFPIPPSYRNVVLISPKSKIIRPEGGMKNASVIKADAFWTHAQDEFDKAPALDAAKIVGQATIKDFAEKILRLHRPANGIDYMAKFGIRPEVVASAPAPKYTAPPLQAGVSPELPQQAKKCDQCGIDVDNKVVFFCRINKARFSGKTLCRECQTVNSPQP